MPAHVKSEWHPEKLHAAARRAYGKALNDTRDQAQHNAPKLTGRLSNSARIERIGDKDARLSFNTIYAKAAELGSFSKAKTRKRLRFRVNGAWKSPWSTRRKAHPYLKPAARLFRSRFFPNRMKQELPDR